MANRLVDKIRSRGYWQVIIRPTSFREDRVENYASLFPIVKQASVQLRGWDYPHIDQDSQPLRGQDWVGQEFEWDHYLERWRLYQSGQFVHQAAFPYDWLDQSEIRRPSDGWQWGTSFSVADALYQFTEIYEFAARLSLSQAGAEQMEIRIDLSELTGRTLRLDFPNRSGFIWPRKFTAQGGFQCPPVVITHDILVSQTRSLALEPALELFKRFGWDTSLEQLRDLQAELINYR